MYKLLLSIFLIIHSYSAFSQPEPAQALSTILNNLFTFQADFEQTVATNEGVILEESSGRILIAKPGYFLWEVNKPSNLQIIASYDENQHYVLWYYDRDLQQASVQPFAQTVERTPAMLLAGSITNLSELYTITAELSGKNTIYKLIPQSEEGSLKQIDITINRDQHVKAIHLYDKIDNHTDIVFNNMNVIDLSLFEPHFNENTDIIDHRP